MSLTHSSLDEDLVDSLDATLRAHVRHDGLDPQRDGSAVRRLAERVVRDHDQRSLTGAVAPVHDEEALVEALVANVAGFGPLQTYLDDPQVEEIWINDPDTANPQLSELSNVRSPRGVRSSGRAKSVCGELASGLTRPFLRGGPQVAVDVQRD